MTLLINDLLSPLPLQVGSRVQDFGFRVWGLGVWGSGCRVGAEGLDCVAYGI